MAKSIEEKVEEIFKKQLDGYKVKHYTKTESINPSIDNALKNSVSKSGGSGNNYPDIRVLIETSSMRRIPVMIEAKGTKDRLIKYAKGSTEIELVTKWATDSKPDAKNPHKAGDDNYSAIRNYAVNGAVHYANAILDGKGYDEVNNTIKSLVKNIKKPKNIFMYYPYEYEEVTVSMMSAFESATTNIFKNLLTYRDELGLQKDSFVCFKINRYFVILEWAGESLVVKDMVDDLLCANYRDLKTYSVY